MRAVSRVRTLLFSILIYYELHLITAEERPNDLKRGHSSHGLYERSKREEEDRSASPSDESSASEEERYGFNPFVHRNNWLNPYVQQNAGLPVGGVRSVPYAEYKRGEDVGLRVACARLGEMYYYNSPIYQCMVCVCQSFAMQLSPVCVSCQSCSVSGQPQPLGPSTPVYPPPTYPTMSPYNQEVTPVPTFPSEIVPYRPTEQPGHHSCDPLPTNEQFQHPLNPCQICICRKEINMYGVPDVKISCVSNPQCVVPEQDRWKIPEDTTVPLPHCVNFPQQTPFPHPDDSCKECQCVALEGVQTILCKKKGGPGCEVTIGPEPVSPDNPFGPFTPVTPTRITPDRPDHYTPENTPSVYPIDPYKPPTPSPNTVWPNKHRQSPLPGPSPHTSCAPFTPNQPFSHPWDECQVCICTETASPPYIDVEVNCFTKASCCVEVPVTAEPLGPYSPTNNQQVITSPSASPAPQIVYLEPKCKYHAPHINFRDQCQVCFCTTVYNYVVAKCEAIPGCGQTAPTFSPTYPTLPSTYPTMPSIFPSTVYPYVHTGYPSSPSVSTSQSFYPSIQTLEPSGQTMFPSSQNLPSSQYYPSSVHPSQLTSKHLPSSWGPSSQTASTSSQSLPSSHLTTHSNMHPYSSRASPPTLHTSAHTTPHVSGGSSTTVAHGTHGSTTALLHGTETLHPGKHSHGKQKTTTDLDRTAQFQTLNTNQNQIQDLLSLLNQGQSPNPSSLNSIDPLYPGPTYLPGPARENDFASYNSYPSGYSPNTAITSTFNAPNDYFPNSADIQNPVMYDQGYQGYQENLSGLQNVGLSEAQALVNAFGQISQDQGSPNVNTQPGYLQTPQLYGMQGYRTNEDVQFLPSAQSNLNVLPMAGYNSDASEGISNLQPPLEQKPKFQIKSGKPDSAEEESHGR